MMRDIPIAEQAEQALLGSVILNNENWLEIKSQLTVDDFFSPRNRIIFQAYKVLHENKRPIDEVTLGEYLSQINKIKDVSAQYIVDIVQGCPIIQNVQSYIDSVREVTGKRDVMASVTDFYRSSRDASYQEIQSLITDLQHKLSEAAEYAVSKPKFTSLGSIINDYFTDASEGNHFLPIKSGYHELDFLTEGMIFGVLDVLAARPRIGKTAFGLNLLKQFGVDKKVPSAFFSIEMPKKQIAERLLSIMSGISSKQIRQILTNEIEDESIYEKLSVATEELNNAPIFYDEDSRRTGDIIASIKELYKIHGVKFIVIDYLQIIKTERRRSDTRDVELGLVCRELQEVAKSLNINVLLLCQINREAEKNPNKRPRLDQLRESGSIENEAARVMMLYRDDVYNTDSKQKGLCEVIVAKNRFGQTGTAHLQFNETCTKFGNKINAGF